MSKNLDKKVKNIALIAHDERKKDLLEWVEHNKKILHKHKLYATRDTGKRIMKEVGLKVYLRKSGPVGGDIEIAAMIGRKKIDYLFFFWDPLTAHAHDVDIRSLLRASVTHNTPTACNRSTADYLVTSKLFYETK